MWAVDKKVIQHFDMVLQSVEGDLNRQWEKQKTQGKAFFSFSTPQVGTRQGVPRDLGSAAPLICHV